jgi:signal transduction histidine kinase
VTLRRRLGLIVLVASACGLAVLAAVLYVVAHHAAWRQHDHALAARARALAAGIEHEGDGYEIVLPHDPADAPASYVEVWGPDGSVIARSPSLHGADLPAPPTTASELAFEDIALADGRRGRAVSLQFIAREETADSPPPLRLVLAEGNEEIDEALAGLQRVFAIVGLAAIVAIAGATTWAAARGLSPLVRLAREIERIDDRQLATRLSLDGQPAELAAPIGKLNELLGRLEASFARERELTADVSHELRTPLAGLRTLLEVTALGERTTAEYRQAVADALDVVKQLGAMVENLMTLSQLEQGEVEIARADIALRELVAECWRPCVEVAARRGVTFTNAIPTDARLSSDPGKLRIVVGNLLANAAEYTERGGWITVRPGGGVLVVADSGPAIPHELLGRIFDRFWRGDRARSGNGAHCGIGLALSRSLCERLALSLTAATTSDGHVEFTIA